MAYKVLLAGKNQAIIDDFFHRMSDDFECMTTSLRSEDIVTHIKYFKPDAFVYCMHAEAKEIITKLITGFEEIDIEDMSIILIGDSESCNEFLRQKSDIVDLTLLKPINAHTIKAKMLTLLDSKLEARKLREKEQQRLGEERQRWEVQQRLEEEQQREEAQQRLEEQLRQEEMEELQRRLQQEEQERLLRQVELARQQAERMQAGLNGKSETEAVPENNTLKHILVIDDEPLMLRLIKKELADKYNVATAVSGKVAMSFLERKNTDLILLDYEMPEQNGPEVLKMLRDNPRTKHIPVVFLTGISDREKIKKVVAMKPQGYLLKPINHEMLIQTIEQIIG